MMLGEDEGGTVLCPRNYLHCSLEDKRRCPMADQCYLMTRRLLFGPNITAYPEEEEILKRE